MPLFFQDKEFGAYAERNKKKQEYGIHIPAFHERLFPINRTRSILLFLWPGGKPVLFFRSWLPFSKGTRVCFFSFCLRVEMFFSFYLMFLFVSEITGCKIRNYFSYIQFIGFKILFSILFFRARHKIVAFLRKKIRQNFVGLKKGSIFALAI